MRKIDLLVHKKGPNVPKRGKGLFDATVAAFKCVEDTFVCKSNHDFSGDLLLKIVRAH